MQVFNTSCNTYVGFTIDSRGNEDPMRHTLWRHRKWRIALRLRVDHGQIMPMVCHAEIIARTLVS